MKQSCELWWFLAAWLSWNVCIGEFCSQDGNSHSCPTCLCASPTWQTGFYSHSSQKHHGSRSCIAFTFCPFLFRRRKTQTDKEKQHGQCGAVELLHSEGESVPPAQHRVAGTAPPVTELLLFHCRTGRTRTLRASPGGTRVRFHSRARGKATLTATRQTRGPGWTRQSMPMTSPCTCRLQWLWVSAGMQDT